MYLDDKSTLKFVKKMESRIHEVLDSIKKIREKVIGTHLQLQRLHSTTEAAKADKGRSSRRKKERERKKRRRHETTLHRHIVNTVCIISEVTEGEVDGLLSNNTKGFINMDNIKDSAKLLVPRKHLEALKSILEHGYVAEDASPIIKEWVSMLTKKKEQTTEKNLAKKLKKIKNKPTWN
jgi:hypothetical protein